MAWNEPGSSGGDKKEDNDPWTGKPKQPTPPDLEEMLRKLWGKLALLLGIKKTMGNGGKMLPGKLGGVGLGAALLGLILLWLLSGIFIVQPAERTVVLRFGKYVGSVGPGPHWIPRFIETTYTINEQKIYTYSYNAEMLTKDENIVSVAVAVQYRVENARNYLFNVTNATESLKQATASALRQVIGHTDLIQVLTSGREQIRQEVQAQLAKILARYNTGLLITDVAMQPAKAPDEVKDAFDDAIKAQEDEQRYENQAQAYAMQVEPVAKGQAQRLLADAKAYQQQVVLHARADVAPFLALLPQYQKAPEVTRKRLYLETLESVLTNTNKVLVDAGNGSNMFYLPLDKLTSTVTQSPMRPSAVEVTPAPVSTTPQASTTQQQGFGY